MNGSKEYLDAIWPQLKICDGNVTKQRLSGPEEEEKYEYFCFECKDCRMHCYRKSKPDKPDVLIEWEATGWDECRKIGAPVSYHFKVCDHKDYKIILMEKTSTKEVLVTTCTTCKMNCKFQKIIGWIVNGSWQKVK